MWEVYRDDLAKGLLALITLNGLNWIMVKDAVSIVIQIVVAGVTVWSIIKKTKAHGRKR